MNSGARLELLESIVEFVDVPIFVLDECDRIEFANREASQIIGIPTEKLIHQPIFSLVAESHQPLLQMLLTRSKDVGETILGEIQLLTASAERREVGLCIVRTLLSQVVRRTLVFVRERTDFRWMEGKFREATQQFEKIAEMGDDGILIFNQNAEIVFANQMASEITGVPKKDLIGKNFFTVIGQEDREFLERTVARGEGIGQKFCMEMRIATPEGQAKDVEVCIASTRAENGELKTYAYLSDITLRKKFEREITDSEERLRNLFEKVKHGLFISSKEGRFLDCNQALLDMLGYPDKEEFLGINIARNLYVNPEDRKLFQEKMERDGQVKDMEVEFQKRNGEKITVLLTGYPLRNEKGEIFAYEGINLDISERKRIEEELREANEFFMNLIESSVDGIIAADMKGNIFIFNKGAETLTGYTGEKVIGKVHITGIYPEGLAKEVMRRLRSQDHGGVGKLTPIQMPILGKTGEEIPIQLSAALIYDRAGKEIASVGIFTDLRPRLRMERKLQETHLQLVSSEKMASLGKLAAGIAHEINNPLGGILIYSSLMMEDLSPDDPKRNDLARVVQEASRCKEIVKSLLEFARQTEPRTEPTDINRAITDGLFFLENQALFHNIKIVKNLDPSLPYAIGNAGQLKQVFMNIIVNAAEAMHSNGVLTITTYPSPDRKSIFIEFSDTGEGIPEENLTRIFDPFFTTKDVGKGTGLGLATSYGIVETHGGKISVRSKVGEGATFTIELLVNPEPQPFLTSSTPADQEVNDDAKQSDDAKGKYVSI